VAGNVIETREHAGVFKSGEFLLALRRRLPLKGNFSWTSRSRLWKKPLSFVDKSMHWKNVFPQS
jgi:hypothetical protein